MSSYGPGSTISGVFGLSSATGAAVNADATPTLTVWRNDTLDNTVSVTLTNPQAGKYQYVFAIPGGWAAGDRLRIEMVAVVAGVTLPSEPLVMIRLDATVASRAVAGDAMTLTAGERTAIRTTMQEAGSSLAAIVAKLPLSGLIAGVTDIDAINQSASRRLVLACVGQLERPETGTSSYTIELRTFDGDGAAVNADATPTIAPVGIVSGSLAANLGAVSNPATGVYRATYTVPVAHAIEQVRFDGSATIGGTTFTISAYSQVADFVAATFSATDRADLQATKDRVLLALPAASAAEVGGLAGHNDLSLFGSNVGSIKAKTDFLPSATAGSVGGVSTLTQAGVRTALGMASGNLDTQLAALATNTNDLPTLVENDGLGTARFTAAALALAPSGGSGSVVVIGGENTLTALDTGTDGLVGLFVGDRYSLVLKTLVGNAPAPGTGATWTASTTDEATGAAISTDVSLTALNEALGYFSYPLAANDTVSARRVKLTVKRVQGSDVRIFGPLVLNVRDR